MQQLLASIDDGERQRAALVELLGAVERIYRCSDTPPPVWLAPLRDEFGRTATW